MGFGSDRSVRLTTSASENGQMKIPEVPLKALLSAYGAILVVVGVLYFALPSATLGFYGTISLSKLESILAQSLGGAMIGLGVVCWISRARAQRRGPAVLGLIVMSVLWTVVAVRAGLLFDGVWIFWWEAAGLAVISLLLVAIWHSGRQAP
jgi:hypothetical protein